LRHGEDNPGAGLQPAISQHFFYFAHFLRLTVCHEPEKPGLPAPNGGGTCLQREPGPAGALPLAVPAKPDYPGPAVLCKSFYPDSWIDFLFSGNRQKRR